MPLALAFVAGGLATVNPCGFSLLPALLTFSLGDSGQSNQSARLVGALRLGASVGVGILGVFLLVGIPIVLGVSQVVKAVPWAGVVTGVALFVAGLVTLFGGHLSLRLRPIATKQKDNGDRNMFAFGVAYGVASLGCTLPIFLSVIGASLATTGPAGALLVMGFYALGMLAVVMALAIGAALARDGLAKHMRRLVPRMQRVGGGLLTLAGVYLTYYWGRVLWGPVDTLAQDPIVGQVQRFAAGLERFAAGNGIWIVGAAAAIVVISISVLLRRRAETHTGADPPTTRTGDSDPPVTSAPSRK